jgi:transposase InsO family protein
MTRGRRGSLPLRRRALPSPHAGLSRRFLLVCDRDTKFTGSFGEVFTAEGVRIVRTPPQAPRANAHAEHWVRTVCRQCLDRIGPGFAQVADHHRVSGGDLDQVTLAFTEVLIAGGLMDRVAARRDGLARPTVDDPARPILLAVSDNGPQMTSGTTREFMAMCAIALHFGRPGTPTDQAWIESLFGHVKAEWPHLLAIRDPATLRNELEIVRCAYSGVRLHAGIGDVTPNDNTKAEETRSAGHAKRAWRPRDSAASRTIANTITRPDESPAMLFDSRPRSLVNSEARQLGSVPAVGHPSGRGRMTLVASQREIAIMSRSRASFTGSTPLRYGAPPRERRTNRSRTP